MRKKQTTSGADSRAANFEHTKVDMLIFGGSRFKEREPNENEYTDMCLTLSVSPEADKYELKYLPGARLRCPDKFWGNM